MYIFANFKAYLDFAETNILVSQLLQSDEIKNSGATIGLFPSLLAFTEVEKALRGTNLAIGMQHSMAFDGGAMTGEIHVKQAATAGATYVLIGHSEQRYRMHETDEQISEQFCEAIRAGLVPVLCVGETADELAQNKAKERIAEQLNVCTTLQEKSPYMIAYEPVWAITGSGSGKSCNPKQAEAMHQYIKETVGSEVPVLYGGSVNTENIVSYTSISAVDGVLVGSASTHVHQFFSMIRALKE